MQDLIKVRARYALLLPKLHARAVALLLGIAFSPAVLALPAFANTQTSGTEQQSEQQAEQAQAPAERHRFEILAEQDPERYAYLMEYGEYLGSSCSGCHKAKGDFEGIPLIVGLEADYFIEALHDYKTALRVNAAMETVAKSLDDEMTDALALYFSSQPLPE